MTKFVFYDPSYLIFAIPSIVTGAYFAYSAFSSSNSVNNSDVSLDSGVDSALDSGGDSAISETTYFTSTNTSATTEYVPNIDVWRNLTNFNTTSSDISDKISRCSSHYSSSTVNYVPNSDLIDYNLDLLYPVMEPHVITNKEILIASINN